MDAKRFAQGMTYDEYKKQMTRNLDRLEASEKAVVIDPADVAYWRKLKPLKVVALGEDWCGDVIANFPVLGRLAQEVGQGILDVRIFLRDKNEDIRDRYLNRGKHQSIPVFVFFDEAWNELGVFIERPMAVTEARAAARRKLFAEHPELGDPNTPIDQVPEETRVKIQQLQAKDRDAARASENHLVLMALRDVTARAPEK